MIALKATFKHYTSKDYPSEWDLAFHIQFAILRQLLASTNNWTIEDVLSSVNFWLKIVSRDNDETVDPTKRNVDDSGDYSDVESGETVH